MPRPSSLEIGIALLGVDDKLYDQAKSILKKHPGRGSHKFLRTLVQKNLSKLGLPSNADLKHVHWDGVIDVISGSVDGTCATRSALAYIQANLDRLPALDPTRSAAYNVAVVTAFLRAETLAGRVVRDAQPDVKAIVTELTRS